MDLRKIGNFIAGLRKEHGITQEKLGEKIGVTGKTISRWETGKYMPPADMLLAISELFDVSVNEILSGKRLAAENTNTEKTYSDTFSLKEKTKFYKKKWLKEHIAVMVLTAFATICAFVLCLTLKSRLLGYVAIIMAIIAYMKNNNAMMIYVERNAFDGSGNKFEER